MKLIDQIMQEVANQLLYPSAERKQRMRDNIERLIDEWSGEVYMQGFKEGQKQ